MQLLQKAPHPQSPTASNSEDFLALSPSPSELHSLTNTAHPLSGLAVTNGHSESPGRALFFHLCLRARSSVAQERSQDGLTDLMSRHSSGRAGE